MRQVDKDQNAKGLMDLVLWTVEMTRFYLFIFIRGEHDQGFFKA